MAKIKLYAVKIDDGIAQCPVTKLPLIAERKKGEKEKLAKIVEEIAKEEPDFLVSQIVKLEEVK